MKVPTPTKLIKLIREQTSRPASAGVRALADELVHRYGDTVQAILFYGSCLRTRDDSDGLVDLYLLVDSYSSAFRKRTQVMANKLLPPNVFYLELPVQSRLVRTKYAVLTLRVFCHGTSRRWFHSYLWGRFSQPTGLVYARTPKVAEVVESALALAVITFVSRVLPQMTGRFTTRELWYKGLSLSYGAELRAERLDSLVKLFESSEEYYAKLTRAVMDFVPFEVEIFDGAEELNYQAHIPARVSKRNRIGWSVRSWQGKLLAILRLSKAFFTFDGGLEYIQWKIERHSGVKVEWTPRLEKYPLLAVCVLSWQLYRKGGFR